MDVSAKNIIDLIEEYAPKNTQELWDNSGLQVGDINSSVNSILIAMDITDKCIDYAIDKGINFIITHHPFIFSPIKNIDFNSYNGNLVRMIIDNNITIYTFHTNLDKSKSGTNNVLAEILKLENIKNLLDDEENNIGVYGEFPNGTLSLLIELLSEHIVPREYIRYYGKKRSDIRKVAVLGGSGASEISLVLERGCDVFITSDVKYHDGQMAYENDLTLIDIGHFYSEFPVLSQLENTIKEKYWDLNVEIFLDPVFVIGTLIK